MNTKPLLIGLALTATIVILLILGYKLLSVTGMLQNSSAQNQSIALGSEPSNIQHTHQNIAYKLPDRVEFAGEQVPIEMFDVRESLDREMLVNSYWHSATFQAIKLSKRYFPVIEPILERNGIPDDFKYLAVAESGLRNVTSPAGAKGVWQIMSKTGSSYGLEINTYVDERYNVEKSTEVACKYLNDGYKKFGNWALVAASYNAGMSRISTELASQKVESYYDLLLNNETARYMYRLIAFKLILEKPKDYGFVIDDDNHYFPLKTKQEVVDSTITNLIDFAIQRNTNYKILKELNPWLRDKSLPNKSKKKYIIVLPDGDGR